MAEGGLAGKVVLITGATSGIGKETALALAAMGPRLYLVARNSARADDTVLEIKRETGNTDIHVLFADLSSQADVKRVADEFIATGDALHVLCNNAGQVSGFHREESVDGTETTFALNHLAYYTMTLKLLPCLRESGPSRIVNTASGAYKDLKGRFDFDDYNAEKKYRPLRQYSLSKLANILFTRELARRLDGSGVTVNAGTPNRLTGTRFAHNVHAGAKVALTLWKPFTMSSKKGAAPIIHLCSSPDVEGQTGMYWDGMKQPELRPAATNDDDAKRLWELTATLTGLDL